MSTDLFLVRTGETSFRDQGRLLGRRDLGLAPEGKLQAENALNYLRDLTINEILSSPLARAIQTAESLAQHFKLGIGRDPRLVDLDLGKWEGALWDELLADRGFQEFFAGESDDFPAGEEIESARRRAVASVEQAAADNPQSATLLVVTHGAIIQLILAHYLGMPTRAFVRIQINHGSISVLRFVSDMQPPQVLGINLGVNLSSLKAGARPLSGD